MKTKQETYDLDRAKEFARKLRNTKIKGKRLWCLIELAEMGVATKKQLNEIEEIKKEIHDWELEVDYYATMDAQQDESDFRNMIYEMERHKY